GLILPLALPPLLALFLVGARGLAQRGRPASWKWSGALIAALALLLVAAATVNLPALAAWVFARAGRAEAIGELIAAVAAGMIWGAFALVCASWIFAPIHGLAQARHDAIWPLLRSWLTLAFLRACL